jgi:imidazolonepropionase-like amidohydrolase
MIGRRNLTVSTCILLGLCAAPAGAERPEAFHEDVARLILHADPVIVIDNVRLVDGTGAPAREDAALLIEDGRIARIADAGRIASGDALRIDAAGKTLLPGYVMLHEHLVYLDHTAALPAYSSESLPMPPLYLAAGTTTMRTTGTVNASDDLQVRGLIEAGRMAGPDIHVTAPFLEGPGSFAFQLNPTVSPEEARLFVRYWVSEGATSFKAYMNVSRAVLAAAIDEAHGLGATVTGHLCSVSFEEASALGIDNLEHGLAVASDLAESKEPDRCPGLPWAKQAELMDPDSPAVRALIETLVARGVAVTSTLPVFAAGLHPAIPTQESLALLSPRSRQAAEAIWIRLLKDPDSERAQAGRLLLEREMAFEKALVEAGGTLVVGTDPTGWGGTLPPNSTHAALILLVEAGFTPLEAISLATMAGAKFLGVDDRVGTIAEGKQADLILIDGRPDQEIESVAKVTMVFRDGVAWDPAALIESVRGKVGR